MGRFQALQGRSSDVRMVFKKPQKFCLVKFPYCLRALHRKQIQVKESARIRKMLKLEEREK